MIKRGLLICFVLTMHGAAHAAPAPAGGLPAIDIPYEKHVLANGLTLIIHEDHKAPIVAVNVWYHVGSKDERPGRTGFAHLFEHLMFNGSENHDDEFFRPLEAAGATKMNGTTWLDRTNYFQNVPISALDLTLWLESDRMGHLLGVLDQEKLDEQRAVVQNEKRQRENQPYGKAHEIIAANTYPAGHPYSWTTIGSMEDLDAATLEEVKEWFRTWYGAANAVLVIAGDVRPEDVKTKVERYFGDIPSGPVLRRMDGWVAKMSGEKRATLQDRVPQGRIYQTWNVPGYATRDYQLLQMASRVLAAGKNSRLYKRLVYEDRLATDVSAGVNPFEIGSQLQVSASAVPGGDVAAVENAIDEELARFMRSGPTAEELERARMMIFSSFARGIERIDGFGGKSAILAQSQVYGGSPDFYKQQLGWVLSATAADVQAAAKRWLSDGVFVLEVQPVPEYQVAEDGADRSRPPATDAPPGLELPPLERTTLSNGLRVVLAERRDAPVVQLQLLVDAGYAADSLAKPGTANLAMEMLDEGTRTLDALQIAARAELLGARIGAGSSLDRSFLSLNAISARLPESLALFADILVNPTFPEQELERLKERTVASIRQNKTQPQGIVMRILPQLLYGEEHAYAKPFSGEGTEEDVKSLSAADLRAFYEGWVRPDNATLLVVGDTTLDRIEALLERHLAGWRAPAEPLPKKNLATVHRPDEPRVFLVNRTGAEQSLIFAADVAVPRSYPDYAALQIVNTILGGQFVSRLNMNLREDKRWSYGASTQLWAAEGQGPFIVRAPVQTDKTAEAIREISRELHELLDARKPDASEIRFARDSLVLSLPGQNETAGEVASSYADIVSFGLPDDYWNEFVDQVSALTPDLVADAARNLVRPDALTWVIVGDLAKIEAEIRELDLGRVKVLDADGNVLR